MGEETKTVETIEVANPAPEPEKAKGPTVDDLKSAGWSSREIELAEKQGRVKKAEQKQEPKQDPKPEPEQKPEPKPEPKAEEPKEEPKKEGEEAKTEQKDRKHLPLPEINLTPEQEKVFLETFPPGSTPRGLYFRMKNERQARQAMEDKLREAQARIAALETRRNEPEPKLETDENGNVIDPEDRPLTMKALKELQQKAQEEAQKQQEEAQRKQQSLVTAQRDQEEYVRSLYPDFDDKVGKAKEIIQRFQNGNIDEIVPEPWKQKKLISLWNQMRYLADRADQIGLDDYNAAFLAYEIGEFHPGSKASRANGQQRADDNGSPKDPNKANGSLTPEQMRRLEATTQRRASSASIPGGGGKRTISVEDISIEDLNRMSSDERRTFKEKYPDRYAKLLRS